MEVIAGRRVYTSLSEAVAPEHTALIVVDMQPDYVSDGGATDLATGGSSHLVSSTREMLPRLSRLVDDARSSGVLLAFIQQTQLPDLRNESPAWLHLLYYKLGQSPEQPRCRLGTDGWQLIPEVAPRDGEIVVRKWRSSAFMGTNLDLVLRANSIETIVVCGVASNGCVMATALLGSQLGYYTVLVADCVAGSSPADHDAAVDYMSRWTNWSVTLADVADAWPRSHLARTFERA